MNIWFYDTREIPTFGGISLALRGSGAFGTAVGRPPPSAAVKEKYKNWGAMGAPYLGRRGCPDRGVSLRPTKKKNRAPAAPQMVIRK